MLFSLSDYFQDDQQGISSGYQQAVLTFLATMFANVVALLSILNLDTSIRLLAKDPNWLQSLKVLVVYFFPAYFIFTRIFRKEDISQLQYDAWQTYKGRIYFVIYLIASVLTVLILGLMKKG